jgi:hypothetical protein
MLLAFLGSFAFLWCRQSRGPDQSQSAPDAVPSIRPELPFTPGTRTLSAATPGVPVPHAASAPDFAVSSTPPAAEPNSPSSDEETQQGPLPVVFKIRRAQDSKRIEAEIRNTASVPLQLMLRAETSSVALQLQLAPGAIRRLGSDDGLDIPSGGRLLIESSPYQTRIIRVP